MTTIPGPRAGFTPPAFPCDHSPKCPPASAVDHDAARVVATHHDQGWVLLCNGVVVFDDTGEILPNGSCVAPHRPAVPHAAAGGAL